MERAGRGLDVLHAVEFSKTEPRGGATKRPRLAPEAFGREPTNSYPLARRRSSCRVTGFLCPPLGRPKDGSTRLSAVNEAVGEPFWSARETDESTLAGLHERPYEPCAMNIQLIDDLTIDLHST